MKNKKIIFYTNCQGGKGIGDILFDNNLINKIIHIWDTDNINPRIIFNFYKNRINLYIQTYYLIWEKRRLPIEVLKEADIFIYQPINIKYGIYSTDINIKNSVLTYLKDSCIKICFPYIYIPFMTPLIAPHRGGIVEGYNYFNSNVFNKNFYNNKNLFDKNEIFNKEIILDLKKKFSKDEIIKLYNEDKIDFKFEKIYIDSMKRLHEKEKLCDIKISHFFTNNNIKKFKLMDGTKHPTNIIYKYIVEEILKKMKIKKVINVKDGIYELECNDVSKYAYNYWKFEWMKKSQCSETTILELINILLE